jgi:hypothetical protein
MELRATPTARWLYTSSTQQSHDARVILTRCNLMNTLPKIKPTSSDLSDRTITLSLTLHSPEHVSLRSCEVLGRNFRNRISFNDSAPVEEVLVARLARAIKACLASLPEGAHVLALPEFLVELPGLALSGLHVMVMEAKDGIRNAIFRFKEFMGAVNKAFRTDIGFQEACASHSEKLAVNVLADVCLPILNLCRSFEEMNFGHDRRKALNIADRAREFEFQTELLKRFIFNANMGHAEAAGAYLYEETGTAAHRISDH